MADDTHIDIGIAVTGADDAAAEIGKVRAAAEAAEQADKPGPQRDEVQAASAKAAEAENQHAEAMKTSAEAAKAETERLAGLEDQKRAGAQASEEAARKLEDEAGVRKRLAEAAEDARRKQDESDERTVLYLETLREVGPMLAEAVVQTDLWASASPELKRGIESAADAVGALGAGVDAFIKTRNPYLAAAATIGSGAAKIYQIWKDIGKEHDEGAAAAQRRADVEKGLADAIHRTHSVASVKSRQRLGELEVELDILRAQSDELDKQMRLRAAASSAANESARLEVRMAKATGGDVALAEANALMTELQTGLGDLTDKMAGAKTKAAIAQAEADRAATELQNYVAETGQRSGAAYEELKAEADKTAETSRLAQDSLAEAGQKFALSRANLIRRTEVELAETENQYASATSAQARKGFDAVYKSVVAANEDQMRAVDQIQIDVRAVNQALAAKQTDVAGQWQQHQTETVQTIEALAPTTAQQAAITGAAGKVQGALQTMGEASVGAMQQAMLAIESVIGRVKKIESDLSSVRARLR